MSKQKNIGCSGQMTLNFFLDDVQQEPAQLSTSASDYDAGLRKTLNDTLQRAAAKGLEREQIASQVSQKLGRPISKAQLDQWCAPSQAGRRLPADVMVAICKVLSEPGLLHYMNAALGFKALTVEEALCAEYGALALMERHVRSQRKSVSQLMDGDLQDSLLKKINRNIAKPSVQ